MKECGSDGRTDRWVNVLARKEMTRERKRQSEGMNKRGNERDRTTDDKVRKKTPMKLEEYIVDKYPKPVYCIYSFTYTKLVYLPSR